MTYAQIIKANAALREFGKNRLPFPIARQVFGITKTVKTEFDFYCGEEKKLVQAYAVQRDDGGYTAADGSIEFGSLEDKVEYLNARTALQAMECDITPITIPASVMDRIEISPEMLEQLDGIIHFGSECE